MTGVGTEDLLDGVRSVRRLRLRSCLDKWSIIEVLDLSCVGV